MTTENWREEFEDYLNKYSSFRYNDFHYPAGWNEEQMDVYRESKMEEYSMAIKQLIESKERSAVISEVKKEVEELVRYELGGYPDEGSYMEASERGEFVVIEEISTLLENLKVK